MADLSEANSQHIRSSLKKQTLPALYDHAVTRYGSSLAMKCRYPWGYQSISYEELGNLISYLGAGLIERGLMRGDRVALIGGNSPEWGIVYAAVTSCGGVVVPLDILLKENEIRHLLMHSEARFLVASRRIFEEQIEEMHLEGVDIIIIGEGDSKEKSITLSEVMAAGKAKLGEGSSGFRFSSSEVEPEDVAAICYTSGTTGQPKGAVLLHRNIVSNIEATRLRLPYNENDTFLCLLPLHHTFATTCNLLAPLFSGSTIVFARSLKPRDIKESIEKEQVTILVGVPLLFEHFEDYMKAMKAKVPKYKRILFKISTGITSGFARLFRRRTAVSPARKRLEVMGLGSLRFCISGAAPLRSDTESAFRSIGLPILQGYGMTEASPVISVNPVGKIKSGTVGPALPGVEVATDQPNDEGIGEIVVSGPNIMREYFKNPESTRQVLREGKLYTGDLGTIDAEEYITIVGRKKSVIVTAGGKNVYPDEIEILLDESPYILESVVLSLKDKRGNDRIGAVIVPNYDALGISEELKKDRSEEHIRSIISAEVKRVSATLPEFKRILDFQIWDEELPKTTTHKVKRHLVKWIEE